IAQMVRLQVAQGTRLQEAGDLSQALAWFAEALRGAQRERLPDEAHRLRLALALRQHPRLLQAWFPEGAVSAVRLSPDARLIAIVGGDGIVRLWETAAGRAAGDNLDHGGTPITAAGFRPGGRQFWTITKTGLIVWDMATRKPAAAPHLEEEDGVITSASYSV